MKRLFVLISLAATLLMAAISCERKAPEEPSLNYDYLCFTAQEAGSTVFVYGLNLDYDAHTIDTVKTGAIPQNMEYSFDKKEWNVFQPGVTITLETVGDKVFLRGNNPERFNWCTGDENDFVTGWRLAIFQLTGKIAASGNIMTLIDAKGETKAVPQEDGCFAMLFYYCDALVQAPELPATELAENCYEAMFAGCSSLAEAPELPATEVKIESYNSMFQYCSSLVAAPELPATKLGNGCYKSMFFGCSSLQSAPEILPAVELTEYCYAQMFTNCRSIVTAPVLPAKRLSKGSYTAMFDGCKKLNYVKALFEMTDEELNRKIDVGGWEAMCYTDYWLDDVSSTGTFVKSQNAVWTVTGKHGVPKGWTVVTE